MKCTIPFTEESVRKEICGRTLCYADKDTGDHRVRRKTELVLFSVPGENGVKWKVDEGRLSLLSDRESVTNVIDSVEIANNVAFLSGKECGTGRRFILYERSFLGTDFQVVISSHVDYESMTVNRAVRSLLREGVPAERITVVVGGSPEDMPMETTGAGYRRLQVTSNLMGCTGLAPLIDGRVDVLSSYALLMHDTCEVSPGFGETIKKVDVGLPYDLVEGTLEIGLWSGSFLKRLGSVNGLGVNSTPTHKLFYLLSDICNLSCMCDAPKELRSRDVYGTGNIRKVTEIAELGIRKYTGAKAVGGRP